MIAKKERNMGIELLRIVSMFMIVLLHGVFETKLQVIASYGGLRGVCIMFVYGVTCCAVNVYAMITGYVCVKAKHRPGRFIELWLQVFALNVAFSIGDVLRNGLRIKTLLHCAFPVLSATFWYFTAYTLLFFCIPYLNRLLLGMSRQQHKKLIHMLGAVSMAAWFALFCLKQDGFSSDAGYSTFWLIILYCAGAYIKRCENEWKSWGAGRWFAVFVLASVFNGLSMPALKWVRANWWDLPTKNGMFISYMSPTIILAAVALFLCCLKLRPKRGRRMITGLGSLTFGIYIIHMQPFVRELFFEKHFDNAIAQPWYTVMARLFGFTVVMFAACMALEWLRKQVFRLLRIPKFAEWLAQKGSRLLRKLLGSGEATQPNA